MKAHAPCAAEKTEGSVLILLQLISASRFYEVSFFQNLTTSKGYVFHYIQVDMQSKSTQATVAENAMRELASTDSDVILLYVRKRSYLLNKVTMMFFILFYKYIQPNVFCPERLVRKLDIKTLGGRYLKN